MSPMIVTVIASNDNLLVSSLNNNDVLIIIQDLHIDHDIDIDVCDRQWLGEIDILVLISCRLLVITENTLWLIVNETMWLC